MRSQRGRYFPLSLPRRWIGDLLYYARQVPTVPVERVMDLKPLLELRERVGISWPALFLKAFGLAAKEHPELRYALLRYPWTRCYEHPRSVASVAIERKYEGEPAVFFGQIQVPEAHNLHQIDGFLQKYKHEPLETFGNFRRLIRMTRLPLLMRRLAWWLTLNWSGEKRAKRLGTFGFSVYSSLGASSTHPLSPLSFLLNYGVIDELGRVTVRLVYDHRIVDGAVVARALSTMEAILTGTLLDELERYERQPFGSYDYAREANEVIITRRSESLVSG